MTTLHLLQALTLIAVLFFTYFVGDCIKRIKVLEKQILEKKNQKK